MKGATTTFFLLLSIPVIISACTSSSRHFKDPIFVKIAEFQDHGLGDSLYHFFKSTVPEYRATAALAFASIKDTSAAPALGALLLEDPDTTVRENAAFALGQSGGIAAVNALIPALQDKSSKILREVLEALGKTIKKSDLPDLYSFEAKDPLTEEGLAWAIYRLGSRGLADSIAIEKEIRFLDLTHSRMTRLGAANFFARSPLKSNRFESALIHSSLTEPDADVRMTSVSGLKKLKSDAAFEALSKILECEKDYRVRINASRSLAAFDQAGVKPLYLRSLKDTEFNVGIATSEVVGTVMKEPWPELTNIAKTSMNWRIQANLYKAILKYDPSGDRMRDVKNLFNTSKNNYQKAWLLGAIASDPKEYIFIKEALLGSSVPVIKTSAADALVAINRRKDFLASLKSAFADTYRACIVNGDPAVIGIISGAIADTVLGYKSEYKDVSFLTEAKHKMQLPKDIESMQPLEDAIAYLEGKKAPVLKNSWNHPISWDLVNSSRGENVVITTSKGEIVVTLLPDEAPGSVANFIALAKAKYFDGKYFHRTVPNFVIQTGCNRGDGYGSEDYSIRSEFTPRHYVTGSVGMASAGKDTEGTQWFITHSATPQLDGRYAIFAQVVSGMNVVENIEVGDQILSVRSN